MCDNNEAVDTLVGLGADTSIKVNACYCIEFIHCMVEVCGGALGCPSLPKPPRSLSVNRNGKGEDKGIVQ